MEAIRTHRGEPFSTLYHGRRWVTISAELLEKTLTISSIILYCCSKSDAEIIPTAKLHVVEATFFVPREPRTSDETRSI
jgi:hypothetical protein